MWVKFTPTLKSRDTAQAQKPKTQCQWYPMKDVITDNSRTHRRMVFKLGGRVVTRPACVTAVQGQKVKGQDHKVT